MRNNKADGSDFTPMGILLWRHRRVKVSLSADESGLAGKAWHPFSISLLLCLTLLMLVPFENPEASRALYSQPYLTHQSAEESLFLIDSSNLQLDQFWNQTYGQSRLDLGHSIIECRTGGYAIIGVTQRETPSNLLFNLLLIRIDADGNLMWFSDYGGIGFEEGHDIVECPDGGFALVGYSVQNNSADYFVVRTDTLGNPLWNRTYNFGGYDIAYSIIRCRTGGFALFGRISYTLAGLIRLDDEGIPLWNQTYETSPSLGDDTLVECWDGGFAFISNSHNSQLGNSVLFRLDPNGNQLWNQSFGGQRTNFCRGLTECRDGGFLLVGAIISEESYQYDILLIRTDQFGTHVWNTSYGGPYDDMAESVTQTHSGEFALSGQVLTRSGFNDVIFLMISPSGEVLLNWTFGGDHHDRGQSIIECWDRGLAIAGSTYSAETGWDILVIRIPGNWPSQLLGAIARINMNLFLPLFVSIIAVLLGIWLPRRKHTQQQEGT